MLAGLIRRRWPLPVIALLGIAAVVDRSRSMGSADEGDTLVVYNGRSHYGDEQVFEDFEKVSRHRGRAARRHRARAVRAAPPRGRGHAGRRARHDRPRQPLAGRGRRPPPAASTSPKLEANVPAELHDPGSEWWALSTRLRVPVVSTERVDAGAVTSYEDLGDPKYKGRTVPAHLEQRVQPVARRRHDRQARAATPPRRCCARGWPTTRRSSTPTASCSR